MPPEGRPRRLSKVRQLVSKFEHLGGLDGVGAIPIPSPKSYDALEGPESNIRIRSSQIVKRAMSSAGLFAKEKLISRPVRSLRDEETTTLSGNLDPEVCDNDQLQSRIIDHKGTKQSKDPYQSDPIEVQIKARDQFRPVGEGIVDRIASLGCLYSKDPPVFAYAFSEISRKVRSR
jgi:hypothetical protein